MNKKVIIVDQAKVYGAKPKAKRVFKHSFGTLAALMGKEVKELPKKSAKKSRFATEFDKAWDQRRKEATKKFHAVQPEN